MKTLSRALGARNDKTKEFLQTKSRISAYKDHPAKRFAPTTDAIAFETFGIQRASQEASTTTKYAISLFDKP